MKTSLITVAIILLVLAVSASIFLGFRIQTSGYLAFSDAAKFADVAINVKNGLGYGSSFSFFPATGFGQASSRLYSARWIPPLMPLAIAGSFSLFGISDFAVIFTSGIFYLGLIAMTFLIGKRLFGDLVGFLAGTAVAFNVNLLDYATSGASETIFIFTILLAIYLFLIKKRWSNLLGFATLVLMYFTRPHAPIYILGIWLFYLLINYRKTRPFLKAVGLTAVAAIAIELLLQRFSGKYFLESVLKRGSIAALSYSSTAGDTLLRGVSAQQVGIAAICKKVFYNLYNFYKLLPQIASPYMWGLFVIGLFKWNVKRGHVLKGNVENSLKIATVFMVAVTFLVTALTIPFFRYLHPVIPLVYLFATATLVWIVESVVSVQWSVFSGWLKSRSPFTVHRPQVVALIATLLVLFFVVGQTLGVIFLDSRFKAARTNKGKPPVYAALSWILKDNTDPSDVIITNLDTWGSWYGERKTIWFPLRPDQLIPKDGEEIPFDAIYLTSYLMDDENYYMGLEWRDVFYNPESPEDKYIAENFELKDVYKIASDETYERQEARAVLLVRK